MVPPGIHSTPVNDEDQRVKIIEEAHQAGLREKSFHWSSLSVMVQVLIQRMFLQECNPTYVSMYSVVNAIYIDVHTVSTVHILK